MQEITRRGDRLYKKKEQQIGRILSACSGIMTLVLVVSVYAIAGPGTSDAAGSAYGSLRLSPEAGSYVIVALLGFAVGIFLTLTLLWHSGRLRRR